MLVFDIDDRQGKSRHLRRIGDEDGIKGAVLDGIGTLDSCYPTQLRVAAKGPTE